MAKEIVKYNNKMNNMPLKNFEKKDLDFFYSICSKVKDRGSDLVEIPLEELKEIANYNVTSTKRFTDELLRMNKKLLGCNGKFETESKIVQFNLFSTFTIDKEENTLSVRVNQDMTWLLNNIAKEFTAFELQEYVSLESIYSKALYRLLKQWKSQGRTKQFGVEEIKELLSTPDYPPMKLMDKVIKPAMEDIKKHKAFKNLWCEVVYKKGRGKPVDGYVFHFSDNSLEGQVSFSNLEEFNSITEGLSTKEKAAVVAAANNMLKAKSNPKTPKKNSFNNFEARKASTPEREARYQGLLEKSLLGIELTEAEQSEFSVLSAERNK